MKEEKEPTLAVFIDFENLALGFTNRNERVNIGRILARLLEKGHIVVKRAYADWKRYASDAASLHEAAIELIEVPARRMTGKNSADMRLCVDAMDMSYSKPHIDTFVIASGDSDFSPLVSKLRENNKHVIGLGLRNSTSALLRDNCDEYIFYEDLTLGQEEPQDIPGADDKQKEVFGMLLEALQALRRENRETLWSSLIKTTIKRKNPSFNEAAYGYKSFSRLLEDAAQQGLIELQRDAANRTHIVTQFGAELNSKAPVAASVRRRR
ncbi:MAG TPA: NYN domain-containing protein [Kiritimatiellia bacterium]|nr:NYN domain-containing protein [Kiritimatiellia bacterium]HSA19684.1 NYN domain-containing protein [Kiritimatiellia bacterium]